MGFEMTVEDRRRAESELRTRHALEELPGREWSIIGDLHWPGGRYGHVDHVVVGPSGVYVIDTQPWHGTVSVYGGHLRHDGRVEDAVVTRMTQAAEAVALLVPGVPRTLVKPVVVVPTEDQVYEKIGGVRIIDTATLVPALEARQHAMSTHQVTRATQQLTEHLHDDRLVKVAAKASRAQRREAARRPSRLRRIPVIRLAIASWFLSTAILAPQVFTDSYEQFNDFLSRQVDRP
jgi:hypothetical protein